MADYAAASGAKALVMCPLNDGTAVSFDDLVAALKAMKPILEERGLTGLVEPLGFPVSSLRTKAEAIKAIKAINAAGCGDVYRLVHDTFHHHLAGETEFFPNAPASFTSQALLIRPSPSPTCWTPTVFWSMVATGWRISRR